MNSHADLLRVARTRECNTQQSAIERATSPQHPAQQPTLKAAALLVLARNNARNNDEQQRLTATQQQQNHLRQLAASEGMPDDVIGAYLRALDRGAVMDRGIAPAEYTQAVHCAGCGPVWLWRGAPTRLLACPWCFRRKAGKAFPRPAVTCGNCTHYLPDRLNPLAGVGGCRAETGLSRWPMARHRCAAHVPTDRNEGGEPA